MRNERLDIRVPRNGDYHEGWQIADIEGPIDLTGCTVDLFIRAVAGQGAVLHTADIDLDDPANGYFNVRIDGTAFAAVPGAAEVVRLAYDVRITYPDSIKAVPVAGQILLTPGATY